MPDAVAPVLTARELVGSVSGDASFGPLSLVLPAGCLTGLVGGDARRLHQVMLTLARITPPAKGSLEGPSAVDTLYVPQSPSVPARATVSSLLRDAYKRTDVPKSEHASAILQAAGAIGIDHLLESRLDRLPVPQRRRVVLAIGLIHRPTLVLFDEPLRGTTSSERRALVDLIRSLPHRHGCAVAVGTTSPADAHALADHLVILGSTAVVEAGDAITLTDSPGHLETMRQTGAFPPNEMAGTLESRSRGIWCVTSLFSTPIAMPRNSSAIVLDGRKVQVAIRPEGIRRSTDPAVRENGYAIRFPATPSDVIDDGTLLLATVTARNLLLTAIVPSPPATLDAPLTVAIDPFDIAIFGMDGAFIGRGVPDRD